MKPFVKGILFIMLITLFNFLFRKGLIASFIPFMLPLNLNFLFLFTLFAVFALLVTKWFAKSDEMRLSDLGISFSRRNHLEFFTGFLVGVLLWGIVSISQSLIAGFSWVLRPDLSMLSLIHGLCFIFIADFGTELYTRGYGLTKFEESFGAKFAIIMMVFFVSLKSFSFNLEGSLLFYTILIPALHTVFFSIIYYKTKRLGASLGLHTGANFVTISVFDLRIEEPHQVIPAGVFKSSADLESLSIHALQLPWVLMAIVLSVVVYIWWVKSKTPSPTVG